MWNGMATDVKIVPEISQLWPSLVDFSRFIFGTTTSFPLDINRTNNKWMSPKFFVRRYQMHLEAELVSGIVISLLASRNGIRVFLFFSWCCCEIVKSPIGMISSSFFQSKGASFYLEYRMVVSVFYSLFSFPQSFFFISIS